MNPPERAGTPTGPWPKIEVIGSGAARRIVERLEWHTLGLRADELGWLDRGEVAGIGLRGPGGWTGETARRYTEADALRDRAPTLLAQVADLEERVRVAEDDCHAFVVDLDRERKAVREAVAEVAALRGALRYLVEQATVLNPGDGDPRWIQMDVEIEKARAALAHPEGVAALRKVVP